ncbi:IclR family transcriptional regulator [Bradyrhizobium sp.]|uniref:IclR family transcriptional regulator n=1 Tax=Bradyrhizobium sp. TaxID=376 RepID=UPI001431636A|nr:IclR family transcriptional regulator [Bradyrhizobium sp.]
MLGNASMEMPGGTQSIQRAVAVLRILATSCETGLGLTQISKQAELTRPTTHRILSILVAEGIVEQRPTGRYVVGEQIMLLALARRARDPLREIVSPHLRAAVDEFGDTGFFTRRSGLDTVCVARQLGTYAIQVLAWDVGDRRPLGITNAGIAILSGMQVDAVRGVLSMNRPRFLRYGVTAEAILREVTVARAKGFSLRAALVPGASAVSVPVRTFDGDHAALTLTPISRRISPERTEEIVTKLRMHAAEIDAELRKALPLRKLGREPINCTKAASNLLTTGTAKC